MPPHTVINIKADEELLQRLTFIASLWHKPIEDVAAVLLTGTVDEVITENVIIEEAYGVWLRDQVQQSPPVGWTAVRC